jgi:uncharacterized protein (TIGR00369 family)
MRKQANSEDCFVCGIANPLGLNLAFYEHPDGSVRSNLTIRSEFQGWPGVAHGGIIATLLDEVTARVYMNDSTENKLMMTGKLEIRYRKPVPVGEPIEIVGMPGELNGRIATARGELRDANGTVLAEAVSTLVQASDAVVNNMNLDTRKWIMIPDKDEK